MPPQRDAADSCCADLLMSRRADVYTERRQRPAQPRLMPRELLMTRERR